MQQQQSSDLHHPHQQQQQQQQNGSVATGPPGGGGGTAPNSPPGSYGTTGKRAQINGGRFDFEDGGTYCGGWEEGKAHGYGVCTGPKHQGAYAGAWNYGFEVSGVYIWPSGSSFEGQWQNGRRHGLGVEQRGRLIYRGEWTSGYKGRYGVRQSATSTAKYEGTWANGLQDGYGSETYADGGASRCNQAEEGAQRRCTSMKQIKSLTMEPTSGSWKSRTTRTNAFEGSYQGQWQEGKRHGYGVRTSAPFGLASHYRPKNIHSSMSSLRSNENADPSDKRNHKMDDVRGGFVLKARSDEPPARRNSLTEKSKKGFLSGLKIRKQRSTGDLEKRGTAASGSIRSTVSTASWISTGSSQSGITSKSVHTDSNASFTVEEEQLDPSVVETYMGEWKRDKRDGYGISERSDGLKYEGEWHNNKKHGYGVTTFRDGTVEEGKYKNNILITSQKKKHLFLIRSRKFRERIEAAVSSAQRASKIALQKADIAISRTATARGKAEYADSAAEHARIDCETAVATAREFAPDFKPTVLERFERLRYRERFRPPPPEMEQPNKMSSATNSPSSQLTGNKVDPGSHSMQNQLNPPNQPYQPHQPQTQPSAFQQPQPQQPSAMSRRTSMLTKQQPVDFSQVPNQMPRSMYSQPPQPDLGRQMSQQEAANSMYTQATHPQQNPSYQFQQQQPPGQMGNYLDPQQQQQQQQIPRRPSQMYGGGGYTSNPGMMSQSQHPMQQQHMMQQSQNNPQMHNTMQTQMYGDYQMNQMNPVSQQNLLPPQQSLDSQGGLGSTLRRSSRLPTEKPMLGQIQQSSIDHFDHYKRAPSRDSSEDRYARAASRMSGIGSRQPSVDRIGAGSAAAATTSTLPLPQETPERTRSGSMFRGPTLTSQNSTTGNGTVPTGTGASRAGTPSSYQMKSAESSAAFSTNPGQPPFEDVLLRQRNLGQDIIPSPSQPKRTESLFVPPKPVTPAKGGGGGKPKLKSIPINVSLQRKKSLPDFQELPRATEAMSREEVSVLGSARREEVRRQIENSERLKANPLLYLVSPQVKDWFSRQQLVLLVLVVNVALAIMFFKMLT